MKQQLNRLNLSAALPYVTLLLWIVPLLLFNHQQQSLIAHDEGIYAWRARWMVESGDWLNPGAVHYGKTPGIYWLIASSFSLFGISEATARLPSIIASMISVLLLYEIGKILLNQRVGWLAAAILSTEFLWLQYSRLAVPDVPLACLTLLSIWLLLKAELQPKYDSFWRFGSGLSCGLGFLLRSYMIFLPMIALLPYLIWEHRRHRHLSNPIFFFGFVVGLTPTIYWLLTSWLQYGEANFAELFGFILHLNSDERNGNNLLYYLWNIPARAFPWPFFSLLGLGIALGHPIKRYQLILVGFPLILLAELSIFSTRIPHYALSLYPFVALLAALALDWLSKIYPSKITLAKRFPHSLSYAVGSLSCLLVLAGLTVLVGLPLTGIKIDAQSQKYAAIALALGFGWLIVPIVWIGRHHFDKMCLTARYWLAGWLLGPWIALAVAGITGLLGDYNPEIKTFLRQPEIAVITQSHPVSFIKVNGKTAVLLRFYTPRWGQVTEEISDLPNYSYAWIKSELAVNLAPHYRHLGVIRDYQLIQVLEADNSIHQTNKSPNIA